jgi:hypothetical protein
MTITHPPLPVCVFSVLPTRTSISRSVAATARLEAHFRPFARRQRPRRGHSRPWFSFILAIVGLNDFAEPVRGPLVRHMASDRQRTSPIAPHPDRGFVQSGSHGGVWVKRIWIQRRICKTPAVVSHPRSEPASVIWSFPHQIKLTFGRRVMRPHHNPACGGQGSRGRDHS